jgi:general secretion pathway protein H
MSIPGIPGNSPRTAGFTLVELSIVLFVLGLVLWIVAPRLAGIGEQGRDAAFRSFSAGSESAFDGALFEKKEWRLLIDPRAGSYRFVPPSGSSGPEQAVEFGSGVAVTGVTVEGEARSTDAVTEIRYMPGGRMPDTYIHLRDSSREGQPTDWTLHVDPTNGSVDVLEGNISRDG